MGMQKKELGTYDSNLICFYRIITDVEKETLERDKLIFAHSFKKKRQLFNNKI